MLLQRSSSAKNLCENAGSTAETCCRAVMKKTSSARNLLCRSFSGRSLKASSSPFSLLGDASDPDEDMETWNLKILATQTTHVSGEDAEEKSDNDEGPPTTAMSIAEKKRVPRQAAKNRFRSPQRSSSDLGDGRRHLSHHGASPSRNTGRMKRLSPKRTSPSTARGIGARQNRLLATAYSDEGLIAKPVGEIRVKRQSSARSLLENVQARRLHGEPSARDLRERRLSIGEAREKPMTGANENTDDKTSRMRRIPPRKSFSDLQLHHHKVDRRASKEAKDVALEILDDTEGPTNVRQRQTPVQRSVSDRNLLPHRRDRTLLQRTPSDRRLKSGTLGRIRAERRASLRHSNPSDDASSISCEDSIIE